MNASDTTPPALRVTFPGTGRPAAAFDAVPGRVVTIGRLSKDVAPPDVVLQDASVSRRHAELGWREGCWQVRSVGKGGSMLDGTDLAPGGWTPFQTGSTLAIGPYRMRLVLGAAAASVGDTLVLDDGRDTQLTVAPRERLDLAQVRLKALLAAARRIGAADEMGALFEAVVHALAESGDFDRAVLVRCTHGDAGGEIAAGAWEPVAAWAASVASGRALTSR